MLRSQPGTSFFEGAKSSGWFLRHDNEREFRAAINLNRMLPSYKKMSGTKEVIRDLCGNVCQAPMLCPVTSSLTKVLVG